MFPKQLCARNPPGGTGEPAAVPALQQPKQEQHAPEPSGGQDGPSDANVLFDLPEPDDRFIDYGEPDLDPSGGNVLEEVPAEIGCEPSARRVEQIGAGLAVLG